MQQPNDTKIFTGVMDTDSAPFNINQVDVTYRLNLINLYNDQGFGSNENIVSFLPLFNQFLTTAPQKCLGCFEDVRGNSIIFFIYSEDKKHGIYRWYQDKATNGVIEKIYQVQDVTKDCLNFQEDNLISHVSLVDELLIWTDGYNEPRCMNIVRANTTNKQRVFNLYFDSSTVGVFKTFTLNIYASTNYTYTWNSSFSNNTIDKVVSAFTLQADTNVQLANYVKIENKKNFAQITLLDIGDYMINVTPNAYVIAENFYPDVTPTTYSYAPLNSELITAIKYPPLCSPNATYTNQVGLKKMNVLSRTVVSSAIPTQFTYGIIGLQDDSNNPYFDNIGIATTGNSTINFINIFGTPTWSSSPTGFVNNTALPKTIDCTFTFNFSKIFSTNAFNLTLGKFDPLNPTIQPSTYTIVDSAPTLIVVKRIVITIPPATTYNFYFGTQIVNLTFSFVVSGVELNPYINNKPLSKGAYKFRAKYIYKDNQQSVYGAISNIATPDNIYQDAIIIDYSDKRLTTPELVSDIKNVVLAVSEDDGLTWYDFKTLERYEFLLSNQYVFTGEDIYLIVDSATATLSYHNIPLTAKSQEFIDDRIFYGAIKTGYDSISVKTNLNLTPFFTQTIITPTNINNTDTTSILGFKRGGKYKIGIVYSDDADRKSGVCPCGEVIIPYYTDVFSLYPSIINWEIYSEPPSWATKYHFVRTNDLTQSNFLLFITNKREFIDINGNVTANSSAPFIRINFDNISEYTDKTIQSGKIDFSYVDGSRIRFIKNVTSPGYFKTNDFEIIRVDATDVYINNYGNQVQTSAYGDLVEIYSPKKLQDDDVYYEFSQCYEIKEAVFDGILKKYHCGESQNQSYFSFGSSTTYPNGITSSSSPAKGSFVKGDVFYRNRNMPYDISNSPIKYKNFYVSSNTPNDYISEIYTNDGRPNIVDLIGQIYQPTGVVFTNRYISNTKINGLNAVEPANIRQYSTIYGDLNCMRVLNNDILRLIFANGYQLSIYVNQGVIRQTGGANNLISIYDDVAGNSHIIQKSLGTLNAESCVINDEADLFGWDETEGVDWLSASNSLVQVSEYKMMNVFNEYGQTRRQLDRKKSHTPAVYDLSRDLMVLTLNTLQPIPYIVPSLIVKLPDLSNTTDWEYGINIHPNNASYYEFNPSSTSWFDLFTSSLAQLGQFTLTQNADGSFKVEAPSFVGYNNSVLVLSAYNKIENKFYNYSYSFQGGQQASSLPPFDGVTIAYNRKQQGWQTYFSFLPEMYGRLRNQIVSFDNGVLYLHDRGVGYNNFYGQQYGSKINFILNKDYPKVKTPLSLWYRGKGNWAAKVGYSPNNMETEMIPANWRLQENGYSTEILRDKNDPAFTNQLDAWVNGQEIRGDYIEIELSIDSNQFAAIDSEKTIYTYSEIS